MKPKPIKINAYKNETVYRFGDWLITVERKTAASYACGLSRRQTWSEWYAINTRTRGAPRSGSGGVRNAVSFLMAIG